MKVKDIKELSYPRQKVEIACKDDYFYGYFKDVPLSLLDKCVDYIAAGIADTDKENNVLLLDVIDFNRNE